MLEILLSQNYNYVRNFSNIYKDLLSKLNLNHNLGTLISCEAFFPSHFSNYYHGCTRCSTKPLLWLSTPSHLAHLLSRIVLYCIFNLVCIMTLYAETYVGLSSCSGNCEDSVLKVVHSYWTPVGHKVGMVIHFRRVGFSYCRKHSVLIMLLQCTCIVEYK